jgi:hypothetical protein
MRTTTVVLCAALATAGALILTCSKSNNNPSGPGAPSSTWTYSVSGDSLTVEHPQTITTHCSGSQWNADTTPPYTETRKFALLAGGNTLMSVGDQADTMYLTRIGSGTGIQGQWLMNEMGVDVTIEIGPSTITASVCFADIFMAEEAAYIEADYNITVVRQSCSSVLLVGHTSNEQVTITYTPVGNSPDNLRADETYSSNNPQHAPGTRYADPVSCPNQAPAWVSQFLVDNP